MNDDLRTADSVLGWLHQQTETRKPISPHLWMEAAQALNVLSSDENDKLISLESEVAQLRVSIMESGKSVTAAKVVVEASPLYSQARKQRAKMEQIKEAVRLAKLSARIKSDEMRSGL